MPRRVNKPAIAILTLSVMAMTIFAGVLLVRAIPSKDPLPLAQRAQDAMAAGDYQAAVNWYQSAFQRSQDGRYLMLAGDAARDMGDSGKAFGMWQLAVLKDPGFLEARQHALAFWLELLEMNGWRVDARSAEQIAVDADALLKSQPEDFTGLFCRGLAYINQRVEKPERETKGLEDLTKAHALQPTDLRVLGVLRGYWLSREQPEQAEKLFRDLIQKMPQEPAGYLMLGQLLLVLKKQDAAIEQLQKAVALGKGMPMAAVALAQAHAIKRDYVTADQLLVQTIEVNPDSFEAWLQRVRILQAADRTADALAVSQEWLKRPAILKGYKASRNKMQRIEMQGQAALACVVLGSPKEGEKPDGPMLQKAQEYIKSIEKEAGQSTPYTTLLAGRIERLRGNLVEATKLLEKADRDFKGTDPDCRLRLAELYLLQREPGLAQQMLASVIQLAPEFARAHYMAAVVAAQLNDPMTAMARLDEGLRLDPDSREMKQLKAALLRSAGEKTKADLVEKEIARAGQPASINEQVQQAHMKLADNKPQEAEAIYRTVLAADPANPAALRTLIALLLQDKRETEARQVYDAARKAAPDSAQIRQMELVFTGGMTDEQRDEKILEIIRAEPDEFLRNGQLYGYYVTRRKNDEAQKVADEMERLRPEDDRTVAIQFGRAVFNKDWARAQKYVDLVARKDLDGAEGGFYKARLSMAQGDLAKARTELDLALGKYPSFSDGWIQLADVCARLNQLEDARKALNKALELNPTKGEAYKGLAQIAAAQDDQARFEENLLKAMQFLANDPWVKERAADLAEQKRPQEATAWRQNRLKTNPEDLDNVVRLVLLYERQEQYKQADDLLRKTLKEAPRNMRMAGLAADYWLRRGDAALAEQTLLDLAENVEPDQKPGVTVLLARLYAAQGQAQKAEQTYTVAIKQLPQQQAALYLELAGFYHKAGRIDDAVKTYRQALDSPSQDQAAKAAIRRQMIDTLLQSQKLDEAAKEIEAYHAAFPADALHQLQQGTLLMLQGRTEEAISTLSAYLQREPNTAAARYNRGLLYLATNRLPQAIDDLSLAKQLSPTAFNFEHRMSLALAYEANGQPERAVTELNEILRSHPEAGAVARRLAGVYQRAGRLGDLEVLIRKYMDLTPKDWVWAQMLGRLGEMTGKTDIAVEGYSQAARASEFNPDPVDDLLRLFIAARRYDQAIEYAEKTIPESARGPAVKARLAQALFQQGSKDRAKPLFVEALHEVTQDSANCLAMAQLAASALGGEEVANLLKQEMGAQPDNWIVRYMLVAVLGQQGQWEAAEPLSAAALAMASTNEQKAVILRQRGSLLYQAGRYEGAVEAYEGLLKIVPDDVEAMNNVAYILAENLDRPQEAQRYARRAVELRPRDANVLDTLGWVHNLAGDLDNAVGTLMSALQASPDNVAARFHLGLVYKKQGKLEEARRELERSQQSIEKSPQDPVAQMFQERVKKELSNLSGAAGK